MTARHEVKISPEELSLLFDQHDAMLAALKVIALDVKISRILAATDPKALQQVDNAIAAVETETTPPVIAARIATRKKER